MTHIAYTDEVRSILTRSIHEHNKFMNVICLNCGQIFGHHQGMACHNFNTIFEWDRLESIEDTYTSIIGVLYKLEDKLINKS